MRVRLLARLAAALTAVACAAHAAAAQDSGGAYLFAYQPRDGAAADFETGYKRHLEWHAQADDRLTWYGWSVVWGENIGMFVDGTFGVSGSDMDARPDPGGDAADFVATTGPHALAAWRRTYERLDLSGTDRTLEDGAPSPLVDVFYVHVAPDKAAAFERALHDGTASSGGAAWYRPVLGGDLTAYLALRPRRSFSDPEISAGARGLFVDAAHADAALAMIARIDSEIWRYRADLTYAPER